MSKKQVKDGNTVLYGRNPVVEALNDGSVSIEKVFLQKGSAGESFSAVRKAADASNVPVQFVPKAKIDSLAGRVNHQGVAATTSEIAYHDVYEVLSSFPSDRDLLNQDNPRLVFIDRVTDPHNFGAIIRSALAFGATAVLVPFTESAPLNAAAVKASAGAALRMPVCRIGNPGSMFDELKERGFWIVGADGSSTVAPSGIDWAKPIVLVLGSEGSGIRSGLAEKCDFRVAVPIDSAVESLNVSVAAGILLHESATRRRPVD